MRARKGHQLGFTLVEVVIVVLIVAILAAVALPTVINRSNEAQIVAASQVVETIRTQIEQYKAIHGQWPSTIDTSWFRGNRAVNPFDPTHPIPFYIDSNPSKFNLQTKFLSSNCSMWYNRSNGAFAIRVPRQSTNAETLALYNHVNKANCPSLSYTGK